MRAACTIEGCEKPQVGRGLCGMHYRRLRVTGTTELREPPAPAWMHAPQGNNRYWTRARVDAALRRAAAELKGPLPTSCHAWGVIKKGRMDWPPQQRILEYYPGGFSRAWASVGAKASRFKLNYSEWTPEEDEYLLERAGIDTLASIARHLNRTYQAVRARISPTKGIGEGARNNQGHLSASQLAKQTGAPLSRVVNLLEVEAIPGRLNAAGNRWLIDPGDLTPEILGELSRPKVTYKAIPADAGDYRKRYGIVRPFVRVEKPK